MRTWARPRSCLRSTRTSATWSVCATRSEEHTSELQSQSNLVCRLLLEKKKKKSSFLVSPLLEDRICSTISCVSALDVRALLALTAGPDSMRRHSRLVLVQLPQRRCTDD